jgi:hypothetical protein
MRETRHRPAHAWPTPTSGRDRCGHDSNRLRSHLPGSPARRRAGANERSVGHRCASARGRGARTGRPDQRRGPGRRLRPGRQRHVPREPRPSGDRRRRLTNGDRAGPRTCRGSTGGLRGGRRTHADRVRRSLRHDRRQRALPLPARGRPPPLRRRPARSGQARRHPPAALHLRPGTGGNAAVPRHDSGPADHAARRRLDDRAASSRPPSPRS